MDIKISLATEKDKKQLTDWFKHYNNENIARKRIDCYINHNFTIAARKQDEIVGIMQWYLKEDPKMGLAEFEEIAVKKEYRNQGIGSKLVEHAINSVKEFFKNNNIKPRRIYLFVDEKNRPARALYEKFGFKKSAQIKNLFTDNDDDLIYVLSL